MDRCGFHKDLTMLLMIYTHSLYANCIKSELVVRICGGPADDVVKHIIFSTRHHNNNNVGESMCN